VAVSFLVLLRFKDAHAFRIDVIVAMVLVALGVVMSLGKKKAQEL
jgi:hypothetical protein